MWIRKLIDRLFGGGKRKLISVNEAVFHQVSGRLDQPGRGGRHRIRRLGMQISCFTTQWLGCKACLSDPRAAEMGCSWDGPASPGSA